MDHVAFYVIHSQLRYNCQSNCEGGGIGWDDLPPEGPTCIEAYAIWPVSDTITGTRVQSLATSISHCWFQWLGPLRPASYGRSMSGESKAQTHTHKRCEWLWTRGIHSPYSNRTLKAKGSTWVERSETVRSLRAWGCGKPIIFCFTTNMTNSVAYRYRKSISIIELFVSIISIYIGFLATNF